MLYVYSLVNLHNGGNYNYAIYRRWKYFVLYY
jgi:hypothetical protein